VSGITITDTSMSSPATPHTAAATSGGWTVSWLPGRTLDRNQAITAMTIAVMVGGRGVPRADDAIWLHLDGWAAELWHRRCPRPYRARRGGACVKTPGRAPS